MPKCDSFTKYIPATFAWVLLLGTTSLFFYFPCRDYLPDYPWIPAYQGVITLFVIANFTLATFMDPGVIPRASPEEDREDDFRAPLYKNVEINGITVRMKWCVTCQFYRPPRCSHCSVCNVCIETFDHHCPWVNNCIGRRNYRFFFMFLISLSLHMTSIFTLCLVYVLRHKDELTKVETIVAMVLMGIILLLVIPIYGLTGFHMVLVSRGRTTNEQVTGKFKGGYNPFSRGCSRNCCYILCGPQYPSLLNASKYVGKPKRYPLSASAISTITSENQVKTYMDNSNGVRNASSNAYNKLSPGRGEGSDTDMEPTASQSQDCEPTPPLQRHGSKSNFFLPPVEGGDSPRKAPTPGAAAAAMAAAAAAAAAAGAAGGFSRAGSSPHPRPKGPDAPASRSHTPDALSPEQPHGGGAPMGMGLGMGMGMGGGMGGGATGRAGPSPTMQQRIKAIGVPTPLAMSSPVRRSNPGTPTQPRRPDFIGVGAPAAYYDFAHGPSAAAAAAAGAAAAAAAQARGQAYGSPQRRFLSEGELVRGPAPPPDHLAYARTNNTVDNIRELAGSPQRGVYMWKDTSPSAYAAPGTAAGLPGPATAAQGSYAPHPHAHTQPAPPRPHYDYYRSTPTSPTQQGFARPHHPYGYPPVRGGVAVFPPQSPQLKRKANTPTTPTAAVGLALGDDGGPRRHSPGSRRPMSFVRALEMSDSMELCGGGGGVGERSDPRHDGRVEQHRLALDGRLARSATPTPDRASVYDMNYEISV